MFQSKDMRGQLAFVYIKFGYKGIYMKEGALGFVGIAYFLYLQMNLFGSDHATNILNQIATG